LKRRDHTSFHVQAEGSVIRLSAEFRRQFVTGEGELNGQLEVFLHVELVVVGTESKNVLELQRVAAVVSNGDDRLTFDSHGILNDVFVHQLRCRRRFKVVGELLSGLSIEKWSLILRETSRRFAFFCRSKWKID
jgi:hypothetical protein